MTSSGGGKATDAANGGTLQKRSMRIAGHRTSLALEQEFWAGLEKIANARNLSLPMLIASIDTERAQRAPDASLASAVRVFVLENRL
ncbi:MAG: ribbon-helix-helix domain-containing protein [Hyphomonadaceae bacterium]|nr:ribbon-helix-helix domain-containing protein [Hyphomonadaceae bacterium]